MADYNWWMNKSIYESASQLSPSELTENRGAFFDSIIGTLNHILVGDTIWLKRFSGHPLEFTSLDDLRGLNIPISLDTILFDDFDALLSSRKRMDSTIQEFSYELTDEVLFS
jgi:uncharacterized damage-inducible protein DinB